MLLRMETPGSTKLAEVWVGQITGGGVVYNTAPIDGVMDPRHGQGSRRAWPRSKAQGSGIGAGRHGSLRTGVVYSTDD